MENFVQANSTNLPTVSHIMAWEFLKNDDSYTLSEIRGVKADRSMRQSYVDAAVGYVKLHRNKDMCTLRAQICPEHKTTAGNYSVQMILDETKETIISIRCEGCTASKGGCKHSLAFLMWAQLRSSEPSPTEVICYWRKPRLSQIGRKEHTTCNDFGAVSRPKNLNTCNVLGDFLKTLPQCSESLVKSMSENHSMWENLDMHLLLLSFKTENDNKFENFLNFLNSKVTPELCWNGCSDTKTQSTCQLWYKLRFGRITASNLHQAVRCKVAGALVEIILGSDSVPQTLAMKRGLHLEEPVIKILENKLRSKISRVGFLVSYEYPILGASPDGLGDDYVVEIKCPTKESTIKNYMDSHKRLKQRYKAQIQLQMFIFKKKKGYFIIVDPGFENNKKINIISVNFDEIYIKREIAGALIFYKNVIFPKLMS